MWWVARPLKRPASSPVTSADLIAAGGGTLQIRPPVTTVSTSASYTYTLVAQPVDEVLVVPCYVHPFAKELASFDERFAMCELAMGWLPGVSVSRVEAELVVAAIRERTDVAGLQTVHPDERAHRLRSAH